MLRLLIVAALVLTALFATTTMALSREWAAGEMDEGWQVIIAESGSAGLVGSVMNPDGSEIQPLVLNGAQIVNPNCSTNGDYLIFELEGFLHVMSADGSDHQRINYEGFMQLSISDDGRFAIVSTTDSVGIINVETSTAIELADLTPATEFWQRMSPDGSKIAFESGSYNFFDLYVVNTDSSEPTKLATQAIHPAWSPDGSMIAYAVFDQNRNTDIYLMDIDRFISVRLITEGDSNYSPVFSPDGNQIMYILAPVGGFLNGNVHLMNTDGSNQRPLSDVPYEVSMACFLTARPTSLIDN